jgi:hypothetical protein
LMRRRSGCMTGLKLWVSCWKEEPLPSPLLTKAPVAKGREQDFSYFPPYQEGTEPEL